MKSTRLKKVGKKEELQNRTLRNSMIAGVIGFLSWTSIFVVWVPLASLKKFGRIGEPTPLEILRIPNLYTQSLFVGLLFFLFFYLTLKYKQKFIMWLGIILYALFYLGYLFLLFFFRFTDL